MRLDQLLGAIGFVFGGIGVGALLAALLSGTPNSFPFEAFGIGGLVLGLVLLRWAASTRGGTAGTVRAQGTSNHTSPWMWVLGGLLVLLMVAQLRLWLGG